MIKEFDEAFEKDLLSYISAVDGDIVDLIESGKVFEENNEIAKFINYCIKQHPEKFKEMYRRYYIAGVI